MLAHGREQLPLPLQPTAGEVDGVCVQALALSTAARAGLSSGDLLVSLNGKPVDSLDAYREIAADLPDDGTVPALVNRDGNARFVAIKL